ncbi:MAG TPA: CmcJ/NvfI family oxidoreductase [Rhizomicrobium sp.]|nr:CmcJ/NvfI family oxidoreductase [Rhizomicrobium sp.]
MSAVLESTSRAETTDARLPEIVRAELNYLVPMRERAYRYEETAPPGAAATNMRYRAQSVVIENARIGRPPSLEREGFRFETYETDVRDFFDSDEVARVYDPEVEILLKARTGASRILIFDHTLRRRMAEENDRLGGFRLPATRVHVDYTEKSAPQRVRDLVPDEAERLLNRRYAFINVWRPIRQIVRDAPLALCDARSVAARDLVPADLIYGNRTGEIYYATFDTRHRWLYVPEMRPDEVILLKNFDSAMDGWARFTPHAAFLDPAAPAWARPRESIEVRTIAFFDD